MNMNHKMYFSHKVMFRKIYLFQIQRLSELTLTDSSSVEHPFPLAEHFFRYLTEKLHSP